MRHVRSPWPLQRCGHGSTAVTIHKSAVGAEYPWLRIISTLSLPKIFVLLKIRNLSRAIVNPMMPHLRCFVSGRSLSTPQNHCAILRGYGHAAPTRGWILHCINDRYTFIVLPETLWWRDNLYQLPWPQITFIAFTDLWQESGRSGVR